MDGLDEQRVVDERRPVKVTSGSGDPDVQTQPDDAAPASIDLVPIATSVSIIVLPTKWSTYRPGTTLAKGSHGPPASE